MLCWLLEAQSENLVKLFSYLLVLKDCLLQSTLRDKRTIRPDRCLEGGRAGDVRLEIRCFSLENTVSTLFIGGEIYQRMT